MMEHPHKVKDVKIVHLTLRILVICKQLFIHFKMIIIKGVQNMLSHFYLTVSQMGNLKVFITI